MSLVTLIRAGAPIDRIAGYLDGLSYPQQLTQVHSLKRREQSRLYELAEKAPPLTLEHFVPADRPSLAPVIHQGLNTLPFPGFRRFQKHFSRPDDGTQRLFGFNEGLSRPFIGPGYFVVHATAGNPTWEPRGALVVDYFQVPDRPVPEGWPRVLPNLLGLQVFVYFHTRDFMRRVSSRVSIGAAFKSERAIGAYFTLLREP
jgi:hypothetical protein